VEGSSHGLRFLPGGTGGKA